MSLLFGKTKFSRHHDQMTEADYKLARKLISEELKGEKPTQDRGETMLKLEQMAGDAWFNAVGMKMVKNIIRFNKYGKWMKYFFQVQMLAAKSKAPVYEYFFHHSGSTSIIDFQLGPTWRVMAKVNVITMVPTSGCKHMQKIIVEYGKRRECV